VISLGCWGVELPSDLLLSFAAVIPAAVRLSVYNAVLENGSFVQDNATSSVAMTPEQDSVAHPDAQVTKRAARVLRNSSIKKRPVSRGPDEAAPSESSGAGSSPAVSAEDQQQPDDCGENSAACVTKHIKGFVVKFTFDARKMETSGQDRLSHTEMMVEVLDSQRPETWQDPGKLMTVAVFRGDDSAENIKANWGELVKELESIEQDGIVVELPTGNTVRAFPKFIFPRSRSRWFLPLLSSGHESKVDVL
jgi:hypothetical protein